MDNPLYAQVETLLAKGLLPNAEQTARRMLLANPTDEWANVAVARVMFAQNRHAPAVQMLLKLNPAAHRQPSALACMAEGMLALKQDQVAEQCLQQALAMDPGNTLSLRLMGTMLVRASKFEEALKVLGKLTMSGSASPDDWRNLATAMRKTKRADAAVQALLHVTSARPNDLPAWMELIRTRMDLGEPVEALAELQDLLARHPRNADLLKFAGEIRQLGTTTSNPLAAEIAAIRDLVEAGDVAGANTRLQNATKYHRPTRALKFITEELAVAAPGSDLTAIRIRVMDLAKQYKEAWEPRALLADLHLRTGRASDATTAITYAEEAWNMSGGAPRAGLLLIRAYKQAGKASFATALANQLRALSPAMAAKVEKALK